MKNNRLLNRYENRPRALQHTLMRFLADAMRMSADFCIRLMNWGRE